MRIAIVGAGMAGLACAESLRAGAHDIALFDKGSRPGGRMSTRILETPVGSAGFDLGAQYFSARDPAFRDRVERWYQAGFVAKWPPAGSEAWVGSPGMSAPITAMASASNVRWGAHVKTLTKRSGRWRLAGDGVDEGDFDTVVVAVPAEQVSALVALFDDRMAATAAAIHSQPCWTVMAAFPTVLPIATDVIKDAGAIGWAARNSAKPGRTGPEAWLIQATASWSTDHMERISADVTLILLDAFAKVIAGVPAPIAAVAHRWRYAKSGAARLGCLWNSHMRLGLCGDWLIGPRVECAWLSGTNLAGIIVQKPSHTN